MLRQSGVLMLALFSLLLLACGSPEPQTSTWTWNLPQEIPVPSVPADNPMSADKVELGRYLFYDKNLSANRTQSCGSCHFQHLAFADGKALPKGSEGDTIPRNSMALANMAFFRSYTWANPVLVTLEKQALVPMLVDQPPELNGAHVVQARVQEMKARTPYKALFPKAFPRDDEPFSLSNVVKALGAFQRSMVSLNSAYDQYKAGDKTAMSDSAIRGMALFFSKRLKCSQCHSGPFFTKGTQSSSLTSDDSPYRNNGLYNLKGKGDYPWPNVGLNEFTHKPEDMGKFRIPSLRNIALTGPYMHDGSIATLEKVLEHYAAGGRTIKSGPYAGVGAKNPYKDKRMTGFILTVQEKKDVIAFLKALTDEDFLKNPRFSDPWSSKTP